jgi:uncharacterized protein (DUF305 family)
MRTARWWLACLTVASTLGGAGCASYGAGGGPAPVVVNVGKPGEASTTSSMADAGRGVTLPFSEGDVAFMSGMISHHAQAIEMVDLLKTRTESESMRMLALRIEVSQNDEIAMMRRWLEDRKQPLPSEHAHHMPGGMMPGMLTSEEMVTLAEAKGTAFDRLFLEGMIKHHGGALVMVQDLFNSPGSAQQAEIFDFASHVDADQRMEIARMTQMLKDLPKGDIR